MMPYITAFFMPRRKEDRPDVIVKDANGDLYTKNMSNVTSSTSVTIYASDGTTVLYSK